MSVKIRVWSDLHIDHSMFEINEKNSEDILVLAGDIVEVTGCKYILSKFLDNVCAVFKEVIYVAGNHEYYGGKIELVNLWISQQKFKYKNFHFLNNDVVELNGVRFIGSTLWSNIYLTKSEEIKHSMSDFYLIYYKGAPFTPEICVDLHEESLSYVESVLKQPYEGKTVTIFHHSPSLSFIQERFVNSNLNSAFHSDLDFLFKQYNIDLCIFGHTHQCEDVTLHNTRVVSNARGYSKYEETGFDEFKTVEL